jgi:hypothetical protein
VGGATLARNGRRLNMPPQDWVVFCDGTPLTIHATVDPNATRWPIVKGSIDEATLGLVEMAQARLKPIEDSTNSDIVPAP